MTLSQRLRACARHTGLDAVIELLTEAADEIDALQARAQVQGELSVDQTREMLSVHKLAIVPMRATHAMLDAMSDDDWQWSDLLAAAEAITEEEHDWIDATPQPAQATQAEVTDAAIDAATRHIYHNGRPTSKEYRVGIARAILALRPERVPMTDEQRECFTAGYESAQQEALVCRLPPAGWVCTRTAGHEGPCAAVPTHDEALVKRGMDRLREAHHDITAQAKKEPS